MSNPQVQIGDIWLWCGRSHVLVLDWDEGEGCWLALNINTGIIGHWCLEVNDEDQRGDWIWVA